jgi:hypothetical protein
MSTSSVSQGRILWLDPNKANNVMVNPDDLCIKVEFSTRRKGRSIIYSGAETINTADSDANVTFIEGTKVDNSGLPSLTTRYTEAIALDVMNATKQQTDDFESLGIESIDIEFNTANAPLIKIKFIDVRGNAILSQGSMSKYRMFFELPYPIFSLKVKGFYGGTVNYCLHMQRWNASFNSETGNFEIQADFMGYTYALLTDLLIGLIRASVRTRRGQARLAEKQAEYGANASLIISIDDMLTKFVELNNTTQKISSEDDSAAQIQAYDDISSTIGEIKTAIDTFSSSIYDGVNPANTYFKSNDGIVLCVPSNSDSNKKYEAAFTTYSDTIKLLCDTVNNKISDETLKFDENTLKAVVKIEGITKAQLTGNDAVNEVITHSGGKYTNETTSKEYVKELLSVIGNLGASTATAKTKIDIYNLKRIQYHYDDRRTKLEENKVSTETEFTAKLADTAEGVVGFEPTIRNIFRVLSVNAEIFLEVLKDVSVEAQTDADKKRAGEFNKISGLLNVREADVKKNIIYPWPEYRQEKNGEGYVETWLGKAPGVVGDNIQEVVYVKELHTELLNVAKFDKELQEQIDNAGADVDAEVNTVEYTWYPLTAADTPVNPLMTQNPYITAAEPNEVDEINRLVLLRAFMLMGVGAFNNKIDSSKGGGLLKIMGSLEAENLVAACRTLGKNGQTLLGVMLGGSPNTGTTEYINAIINEIGLKGSNKITNPGGASQKAIMIRADEYGSQIDKAPSDTKSYYYKYKYIRNENNRASYIPLNTAFDGSGFYYNNNTFKSKENLKDLSSTVLFVSSPKNYENSRFYSEDDGSFHVKLLELSEYTASSMVPGFGKELVDAYNGSLSEQNSALRVDSANNAIIQNSNDANDTLDGVNPYTGNYSTLEIKALNYDGPMSNKWNFFMGEPKWKADTKIDSSLLGFFSEYNGNNWAARNSEFPPVGTYLSYDVYKKLFDNGVLYEVVNDDNIYFNPGLKQMVICNSCTYATKYSAIRKTWVDEGRYLNQKGLLSLAINKGTKVYFPFIEFGVAKDATSGPDNTGNWTISLFGSYFYYRQPLDEARALLFLHTIPWQGVKNFADDINEFLMLDKRKDWTFEDEDNSTYSRVSSIRTLFQANSAFIHAPKAWVLFVGAMLWRIRYAGQNNGDDPIVYSGRDGRDYTGIPSGDVLPSVQQYLYLAVDYNADNYAEYNPWGMFFGDDPGYATDQNETFVSVDRTLRYLPKQVRDEFIAYFEKWVKDPTGFKFIQKELELHKSKSDYDSWFYKNTQVRNAVKDVKGYTQESISRTKLNDLFTKKVVDNYALIVASDNENISIKGNLSTVFNQNTPVMNYIVSLVTQPTIIQNANPNIWNYDYYHRGGLVKSALAAGYEPTNSSSKSIRVRADKMRTYLDGFYDRLIKLNETFQAETIPDPDDEVQQEIFGTGDDDTINLLIYRTLSSINDKWLNGSEKNSAFSQCGSATNNEMDLKYAKKFRSAATEASLIDTFRFVDRAFADIGDKFYLNINSVTDLIKSNYNQSYFDIINKILADNNFNFIPLPTFINFNDINELQTIFTPYTYNNPITFDGTGPSFVCVYVGQTSTNLDLGTESVYPDDGLSFTLDDDGNIVLPNEAQDFNTKIDPDSLDGNVPVFAVNYGQQNQNYFRSVKLDQREFTETMESLQVIESISQTGDKSKPTYAGNNLFNVYQTRSYSAEVEMMGSAMIQPMMYFQLNNIPMFRGAYLIYKVNHSIKPHSMTTTFKGNRVKKAKTPLIDKATMLMNLVGTTGGNTQITSDRGQSAGYYAPIVQTLIDNGITNAYIDKGKTYGQVTTKDIDLNGTGFSISSDNKYMISEASVALTKMLKAWTQWMKDNGFKAASNGKYGNIGSTYRSYASQASLASSQTTAAAAGTSYHGWGLAVDMSWVNKAGKMLVFNYKQGSAEKDFDFSGDNPYNPAVKWLYDNSYRFGFANPGWAHDNSGYDEVWHWEYHGTAAKCIMEKSKVIYGQKIDTSKAIDSVVKNPKTADGKEAVYTGCDSKYVKARDGGVTTELGDDADYWSLVAICGCENFGDNPQGIADTAQSIYNRLATPNKPYGKTIKEIVIAKNQFAPTFNNRSEWLAIKDEATALKAVIGSKGKTTTEAKKLLETSASAIKNKTYQKNAREFIKTRTEFLAAEPKSSGAMDVVQREPASKNNAYYWEYAGKALMGKTPPSPPAFT